MTQSPSPTEILPPASYTLRIPTQPCESASDWRPFLAIDNLWTERRLDAFFYLQKPKQQLTFLEAHLPAHATHDRRTCITRQDALPGDIAQAVDWIEDMATNAAWMLPGRETGAWGLVVVTHIGILYIDAHALFVPYQGRLQAAMAADDPRLHSPTPAGRPALYTAPASTAHAKMAHTARAQQALERVFPVLHLTHPDGDTAIPLRFHLADPSP